MLNIFFKDFFFISPFLINLFLFWSFFIKNNFLNNRVNALSKDNLKNSKVIKKTNYVFFINWVFINIMLSFIFYPSVKIDFNCFFFNHLFFNNFNTILINIIFLLSLFVLIVFNKIKNINLNYNIDYISSLINIIIIIPLIYISNNMFSFIFLLELISITILYKFIVSRNWFYNNKNSVKFRRILPKSYLNMLFFQYWANFFSSMLIFFFIFNILFLFGSSDWFYLNNLNKANNSVFCDNNKYLNVFIWLTFLLGFFLKIGFTPLHLFKIEIYKGIPFISIFFYTTFYFVSFFLFFLIFFYLNLNSFKILYLNFLYIFIILGLFYCLFLIFDVNLIKSFFAYSTVVNVLNFIIVFYLLLN